MKTDCATTRAPGRGHALARITLATAIAFLTFASSAQAGLLRYAFSGTVDAVSETSVFAGLTGQPFTGTLAYDTDFVESASSVGDPFFANYDPEFNGSPGNIGITVDFNGVFAVQVLGTAGSFDVLNDDPFMGDVFGAGGDAIPGATPAEDVVIFLELTDSNLTALDSLALPAELDLADWTSAQLTSPFFTTNGLSGTIETLVLVPEPTTALLLGLGLVGLSATRRAG